MPESISSILASEARLINEASEALPHQFNVCTYSMGYIRQAIYLCLTCALPRGICSSCSIACHTDHEQIELFPKRHFRCDCPTSVLAHSCTLHKIQEDVNSGNTYGQNFTGKFCRCERVYDAKKERETMIQCVACEDWYHESCLNLRERPPSREPSPELQSAPSDTRRDGDPDANDVEEDGSEASTSGLPLPLINDAAYESFVCRSCVLRNKTLKRWAGTRGVMVVIRDDVSSPWTILNGPIADNDVVDVEGSDWASASDESGQHNEQVGSKRPSEATSQYSEDIRAKRPRTTVEDDAGADKLDAPMTPDSCLAPPRSKKARKLLEAASREPPNFQFGAGDIFLTDGWRTRWCRCESCYPPLKAQPYLLEEEETYEPPEDPDSAFSLEELGMRALQSLPRDRALDGIRAFNEMRPSCRLILITCDRDDLLSYLRPFAQEGKVVGEADVRRFFEEKQEAMRARREES